MKKRKGVSNVDILGMLLRRDKITPQAYEAGQRFADDFVDAKCMGISAVDYEQMANSGSCGTNRMSATERTVCNAQRVRYAVNALGGMGSPCAKAAWDVIGLGIPVTQWAVGQGYDKMEGKGILIAGLNILARHYGYT